MNDPRPPSLKAPLVLMLGLAVLALLFTAYFRPQPVETDTALLVSDESVHVDSGARRLAFVASRPSGPGLIFYPGAKVRPESYAWLGRALAEAGHSTVIARFPLDFAIFAAGRAGQIMEEFAGVGDWVLAGHSLGGAMAAAWLDGNPGRARGLVFLASYPPSNSKLKDSSLPVLDISASLDGLATPEKLAKASPLLPASTRRVVIEGGNHAQFGEYGPQKGDGRASLEAGRQRAIVLEELLRFLDSPEVLR